MVAANLRFGYPEIPAAATVTTDYTVDADHPIENLFGGSRFHFSQRDAAGSGTHRITFDLGAGGDRAADYLALGRADLLQRDGVTGITLKAHSADDYDAATTIYNNAAFDGETLYGPREEDFYVFFTLTSAYRYWFVQFDSGATETMLALSKLYFGTALDLEHDPEYPWERARERVGPYARAAEYRETLRFKGVSWAKTTTFIDEVQVVADARPVFLMTTSYHSPLGGNRILFAAPENPETPMVLTDQNDIVADFVEVL